MVEGDDLEIKHDTFVRPSADQVYNAFTTAEGLDAWFTKDAKVDPRPGGEILFRWRDWGPDRVTEEDGGPVLEAVPPERFVFQWHPENASYATTVEVDFTQMAAGTTVRLREYGYLDIPPSKRGAAGWGEALTLLVEHGVRY